MVVREPLSEAVSLMGEVIQVYYRLLRRRFMDSWQPPRWDLSWWQRWAPVVISSYSTRTMLGPHAFCPPADALAFSDTPRTVMAERGAWVLPAGYVNSAASWADDGWLYLSQEDIQSALESLYRFDLVLELGSPDLIDITTSKLLGWSTERFSKQGRERSTIAPKALSWQELEYLAAQMPPETRPQQQHAASLADHHTSLEPDVARRMMAEVWVRRAYRDAGEMYVITPLLPSQTRQQMPAADAVRAAQQVLQKANHSRITVLDSGGFSGGQVVVKVEEPAQAAAGEHSAAAGRATLGAQDEAGKQIQFYHVWPKHGVVLDEQQYEVLLKLTAADQQLHQHASVLQLLDAAWLTVVGQMRGYLKLVRELGRDMEDEVGCGFAGLDHFQQ